MELCQNFKGIVSATDTSSQVIYLAHVRCKQWTCEYCARQNAKIWRAHIIDTINKLSVNHEAEYGKMSEWTFITLTANAKMRSEETSLQCLRQGWKKLYDRIRREYGKEHKIEYIKVYEQHQSGAYHCHAIISANINKRWLKRNCVECGMGYMADAQLITGHAGNVAGYITKYMTKSLNAPRKGLRRVQGSRAFTLHKNDENGLEWRFKGVYTLNDLFSENAGTMPAYDLTYKQEVTTDLFDARGIYEPEQPNDGNGDSNDIRRARNSDLPSPF